MARVLVGPWMSSAPLAMPIAEANTDLPNGQWPLSFALSVTYTTGFGASDLVMADLDSDGKIDVVTPTPATGRSACPLAMATARSGRSSAEYLPMAVGNLSDQCRRG